LALSFIATDRRVVTQQRAHTGDVLMNKVRETVLSLAVLAAFLLVLAAPFRWHFRVFVGF
jgi:hypothetical protein